jgi:hypothetical protein
MDRKYPRAFRIVTKKKSVFTYVNLKKRHMVVHFVEALMEGQGLDSQ